MSPRKKTDATPKKMGKSSVNKEAKSTVDVHWDIADKLEKADVGEPIVSKTFAIRFRFYLTFIYRKSSTHHIHYKYEKQFHLRGYSNNP